VSQSASYSPRLVRVFVLSPGRSGSLTFVEACSHIANFTAAHESRVRSVGHPRFAYPNDHIEADNRLTWFLGGLGAQERPDDRYVWLRRDRDAVVTSFLKRWRSTYRSGIIEAFAHAIVMQPNDWADDVREDVVKFYVDTVESNIAQFVEKREHMTVWLGSPDDFTRFWAWVGAEGDLKAALETWATRHN